MNLRPLPWLALGLAACSSGQPEPQIRDLRPLQIERDDKITVEANGPIFAVGAATTVTFDNIAIAKDVPLTVAGRAVAQNRVLFDADKRLEELIQQQGGHLVRRTTVRVEQIV